MNFFVDIYLFIIYAGSDGLSKDQLWKLGWIAPLRCT